MFVFLCCICNSFFQCQCECKCSLNVGCSSSSPSPSSPACAPSPHFLSVLPRQSNRPSSCSICKQLKLFLSTLNELFNFSIFDFLLTHLIESDPGDLDLFLRRPSIDLLLPTSWIYTITTIHQFTFIDLFDKVFPPHLINLTNIFDNFTLT